MDLVSVLTKTTSGSASRFTAADIEEGMKAFLSSNLIFLAEPIADMHVVSACRFLGVVDGVVEVDLLPELPAVVLVGLELLAWRLSFIICCSIAHAVQSVWISYIKDTD